MSLSLVVCVTSRVSYQVTIILLVATEAHNISILYEAKTYIIFKLSLALQSP